jgi:hypothetical protein
MKSRKLMWIAALCVLSATVITVSLRARSAGVLAAQHSVSRASLAQPAVYMSNASLRAAAVSNAMLLDDDGAPTRVTESQENSQTIFPPVEEFTLTPPNPAQGINKTILSVHFAQAQAERLASQIPMKLAGQSVLLQRSADDPSTFVTSLDFNWQRFAEEQAQRKEGASRGMMVPVFDGRRFVRTEKMAFVEPSEIQQALQSHQPVQFPGDALMGPDGFDGFNVFPDHQLMMTSLAVVQDNGLSSPGTTARTFDQCLPGPAQGNPNGAWTFNTLMLAIAGLTPGDNPQPAENMLLGMLNSWNVQQPINGFQVLTRPAMGQLNGSGLLGNWPVDSSTQCQGLNGSTACPSLSLAPVRLDAIVNRIDLGVNGSPFPPAGELRFVFTVTTDLTTEGSGQCSQGAPFNIILEYNIPSSFNALQWAQQWAGLQTLFSNDSFPEPYLAGLQAITDQVVKVGDCGGTCIAQVRTNEILLAPGSQNGAFWELREFHFSNSSLRALSEATIAQTPDPQFNTTGQPRCTLVNGSPGPCNTTETLANYINTLANNPVFVATKGAAPPVRTTWPPTTNDPFLGGSALNNGNGFWNGNGINSGDEPDRIDFSANTCNGCHGAETATFAFQQVFARPINSSSALTNFLLGCTDGTCQNGGTQCPLSTENLGPNGSCPGTELVNDPAGGGTQTSFGDIARRVTYLQNVCGNNSCTGGVGNDLLLPFTNKPIGVH